MVCLGNKQSIMVCLRLHPSTVVWTFLLTVMANPFLLRDSCPHLIDEEPQRVSKYMKRCSNSSVINGFFCLKDYHFTSLRLAKI